MIQIEYTVTLKSPLRVATGIGSAGWLDNTAMRNSSGHPIIPGSSIKGRCRAAAIRIAQGLGAATHSINQDITGCSITVEPCVICRLFGAAQRPGTLFFTDSSLDPRLQNLLSTLDHSRSTGELHPKAGPAFGRLVRTNTAIDRRRRVVLPGRLFTYEAIDRSVTFLGHIEGDIINLSGDHREVALLVVAMESITHLGGAKGRGMGSCIITADSVTVNGNAFDRGHLGDALAALGGTH